MELDDKNQLHDERDAGQAFGESAADCYKTMFEEQQGTAVITPFGTVTAVIIGDVTYSGVAIGPEDTEAALSENSTVAVQDVSYSSTSLAAGSGTNRLFVADRISMTGSKSQYSGAIYNSNGTASISNSIFSTCTSMDGGAICNAENAVLTITGSTLTKNFAGEVPSYTSFGGAIYNEGFASISGCILEGNTSNEGGAIGNADSGTLMVSGSTFSNNEATDNAGGGAIDNSGTATIVGCLFVADSPQKGSAVRNGGSSAEITITGNTFTGNTSGHDGAAVSNSWATATIENNTFKNNLAENYGGAVQNYYGAATMSGNIFIGNTAGKYDGGAIYNYGTATLMVSESSFTGNVADKGGAMANMGTASLIGCVFTGNTADDWGGAIYNAGTMSVSGNTFSTNVATMGSAIRNEGTASMLAVSGSTFSENMSYSGGAIFNLRGIVTVVDSVFAGNTGGGGAAIENTWIATITDCSFSDNFSSGGVIRGSNDTTVSKCVFTNNAVTNYGGAIYNNGTASRLAVDQGLFIGNSAGNYGGAIYHHEGIAGISASTFSGNFATYLGGAIGCGLTTNLLKIDNDVFLENTSGKGGAVFSVGTTTIDNSVFAENTASSGGAICSVGTAMVVAGTFSGNSAICGGAIYNIFGTTDISDSAFTGNLAGTGGAIYNGTNGLLMIERGTFSDNTADSGSAIFNDKSGIVNVTGSIFSDNNSKSSDAGAIYNKSGTVNVTGSTFCGNLTGYNGYGGALNNNLIGALSTIEGCVFDGNSADYYGGAIYNSAGTMAITDSTFFGNTAAYNGGAIYNDGSATISGNTFANNTAAYNGGAIYNDTPPAAACGTTVSRNIFANNTAGTCGGAICNLDNSTVTITDSTFVGNSAGIGGAIYNKKQSWIYGTVIISDCIFTTETDTIYNAGDMTIGGTIWTAANITSETAVTVESETKLVLDISVYAGTTTKELLSDFGTMFGMSQENLAMSINVAENQADGAYVLATDASSLKQKSLTVTVDGNPQDSCSVSVGGEESYGDKT
ncbi:MAG: right-handed parallel beta-helix repeat-containing protein [Victivallaceae bacterium]|nr:right-handed parallel beta-helix repeat-containing protein [Victivallaceae bacterium]